jgi:hypothetical protein
VYLAENEDILVAAISCYLPAIQRHRTEIGGEISKGFLHTLTGFMHILAGSLHDSRIP